MGTDIKEVVRDKYGKAALRIVAGERHACCGATGLDGCDPITRDLYDETQAGEVPEKAMLASLGCGNPTALAELKPGETVLDLGSGGGNRCFAFGKARRPDGQGLRAGYDR